MLVETLFIWYIKHSQGIVWREKKCYMETAVVVMADNALGEVQNNYSRVSINFRCAVGVVSVT